MACRQMSRAYAFSPLESSSISLTAAVLLWRWARTRSHHGHLCQAAHCLWGVGRTESATGWLGIWRWRGTPHTHGTPLCRILHIVSVTCKSRRSVPAKSARASVTALP